jgi:hypothetical protein
MAVDKKKLLVVVIFVLYLSEMFVADQSSLPSEICYIIPPGELPPGLEPLL